MTLHPRTVATLDQLAAASWFSATGRRNVASARVLSSWDEAITSCSSDQWQNLLIEASNQYCERLAERSAERFQQWNTIAAHVRKASEHLVEHKTAHIVAELAFPRIFVDTVRWDILHACMEAEYADVYPPGFFASQAYWYVAGHFPCGWDGDFPDGRLVVF